LSCVGDQRSDALDHLPAVRSPGRPEGPNCRLLLVETDEAQAIQAKKRFRFLPLACLKERRGTERNLLERQTLLRV